MHYGRRVRPARYFPVTPEPLRMKAGLFPIGTDFGQGERDALLFQSDDERDTYLAAKRAVPASRHQLIEGEAESRVHEAVLAWMRATLANEQPGLQLATEGSLRERYESVLSQVQEDIAVLHRGDGAGRALFVHVCFPSGWRPELLGGASFQGIHAPVPGFNGEKLGRAMVEAMVGRGPNVRFVWTVACDTHLDHHPEQGCRDRWSPSTPRGWLRIERQVTVPLPEVEASVFLIRTYLTPLDELAPAQRSTLSEALRAMPEEIARYKSLWDGRDRMLELLVG